MRHGNRSSRLGVKTNHRVAMLRNMALGLIEHGRIKTTLPRAKRLRPFVEVLVTRLKNPTVSNLRLANASLNNRKAVLFLAENVSTKFKTRPGGYLRILKLATPRAGDSANMALIEWVDESLVNAYQDAPKTTAKKGAKKAAAGKVTAPKSAKKDKDAPAAKSTKAKEK